MRFFLIMSLLNEILHKKLLLKPNETRITTISGQIFMERTSASGEKVQVLLNESSPGFVIEEVPDMQVAFVLPWLCLGSQDVVCDQELLAHKKIRSILSLGVYPPIQFLGIDYKFLPVYDEPGYNLIQHFPECFATIDHCHDNNKIIFVHCNAGVSRSATIVIAYVMKHLVLDLDQAFAMVKKARPCIKPNQGFMHQLRDWEQTLLGTL